MASPPFETTDPANYRLFTDELVRYTDMDALGHANNNAYGIYFETARIDFYDRLGLFEHGSGMYVALLEVRIRFLSELVYPDRLSIGTRVTRIGTKSFGLAQGLFVERDGATTCGADMLSEFCRFDLEARKSAPLDDRQRAILRAWT